jgi:membrane protein
VRILGRKERRAPSGPQVRSNADARPDATPPEEATSPQPERHEPSLRDPGVGDLSNRDYSAILKRTVKSALADGVTDLAAALAYYSFLAIPSILLVALGIFSLAASPDAITTLMNKIGEVAPSQAISLLDDSLRRMQKNGSGSLAMTVVGFVLALWTTTGAMTAFMRALNRAYDRKETRNFVRQRLVAVEMVVVMGLAFLLVFGPLVLGPQLSNWIGNAVGAGSVVNWIWWAAQWPILVAGLLAAFATVLYLGPNVDHPRWHFITPGAVCAVVVWLVVSGLFAVYTAKFGSYNKAWGSLAAVIVMLTWLWLSSLALLLGAEMNAETERSRELREGQRAEREIQAPAKA